MEIDAWTPGTSNIVSEGVCVGGQWEGGLHRVSLSLGEEKEGGHRLPSPWTPCALGVWDVGQNPTGTLESHDSSHSGGGGRTHRERQKAVLSLEGETSEVLSAGPGLSNPRRLLGLKSGLLGSDLIWDSHGVGGAGRNTSLSHCHRCGGEGLPHPPFSSSVTWGKGITSP